MSDDTLKSYRIEYEIHPLRAIYTVFAGNCKDEAEAREVFAKEYPNAHIRKVTETTNGN